MSSSEGNAKIYGAVETETFITFEGFCKKIYDTEQQKVEVFIDDKKIDVVSATQKIPNIEDSYEVFDTEGFCFTYKLPKEYIGKKHKLEFKTINGEQLIHSPFNTIDITNEKYNEYCFLESLKEPIDENKIKDLYCPHIIGFLATEENLEDEKFVDYIKELIERFPHVKFKGFYFKLEQKIKLFSLFGDRVLSIIPDSIYTLAQEIEIFLWGLESSLDVKVEYLLLKYGNIYPIFKHLHGEFDMRQKTLKDYDVYYYNNGYTTIAKKVFFGTNDKELKSDSYYELFYHELLKYFQLSLNVNAFEFRNFYEIKGVIESKELKEKLFSVHKKLVDY